MPCFTPLAVASATCRSGSNICFEDVAASSSTRLSLTQVGFGSSKRKGHNEHISSAVHPGADVITTYLALVLKTRSCNFGMPSPITVTAHLIIRGRSALSELSAPSASSQWCTADQEPSQTPSLGRTEP